jgi:type I restriction enzyme, S subunit
MASVIRLGNVLEERDTRDQPEETVLSVYREHGVVPKGSRADNFNKTPQDVSTYKLVLPSDVVVNKMKAWQGSVAVSRHRGIVSGDYLVSEIVRPDLVLPEYLHYALRSSHTVSQLRRRSTGIRPSQWRIYWDDFRNIEVFLPPIKYQRQIAALLDTETKHIDRLVATKSRMVEVLLEHRRRALSTRFGAAVTAEGRPSGADPVTRLGYVAEVSGGLTLGKKYEEPTRSYPYLRVANVQDGRLDLTEVKHIRVPPTDANRHTVQVGDVLVLEGNGNPDNLGRGVMWRGEIEGVVLHQNHVHATRTNSDLLLPEFLEALLASEWVRHHFTGGTAQVSIATLSQEQLASLPISLPSLDRQRHLLRWWSEEQRHTHELVRTLQRQVELLTERRRSLISASVTGEMEVP